MMDKQELIRKEKKLKRLLKVNDERRNQILDLILELTKERHKRRDATLKDKHKGK